MYTRKTYRFPGSIEVEEYHSGKYGAPGQARGKKRKPTPEEIKKRNQTNRENYVRRLMKANFRKNDYWITLTYQKGSRPSVEKMRKDVDKLLRKVRSAYRKKGRPAPSHPGKPNYGYRSDLFRPMGAWRNLLQAGL